MLIMRLISIISESYSISLQSYVLTTVVWLMGWAEKIQIEMYLDFCAIILLPQM